jgi:YhcH/YjgK/YiaL family protein
VLNLPDGRHELDGDRIIAMPQGYPTRPRTEGRWEAHRRYIDIQYIISGQETMGWAPVSTLEPVTTFDEAKDVGFFAGNGDMLTVRQGMFALFLPQDAHMPCLRVGQDPEQVRKIVMKVAAD